MFETLKKDLYRHIQKKYNIFNVIKLYFINPGIKCVILFRIQDYFTRKKLRILANYFRNKNLKLTGAEFCIGSRIGEGLIVRHPNGVVIGVGANIGKNCTILQNVTVGENYKNDNNHFYPTIKDNVVICAGAMILGNVTIGDNCVIAANSVVLQSFENNVLIAGLPAKCKKIIGE